MAITTGSYFYYMNRSGSNFQQHGITPLYDNSSKFLVAYNDEIVNSGADIYARIFQWDGLGIEPTNFTSGSEAKALYSSNYPPFSAITPSWLSGSRYVVTYADTYVTTGQTNTAEAMLIEVTSSTNTLNFITPAKPGQMSVTNEQIEMAPLTSTPGLSLAPQSNYWSPDHYDWVISWDITSSATPVSKNGVFLIHDNISRIANKMRLFPLGTDRYLSVFHNWNSGVQQAMCNVITWDSATRTPIASAQFSSSNFPVTLQTYVQAFDASPINNDAVLVAEMSNSSATIRMNVLQMSGSIMAQVGDKYNPFVGNTSSFASVELVRLNAYQSNVTFAVVASLNTQPFILLQKVIVETGSMSITSGSAYETMAIPGTSAVTMHAKKLDSDTVLVMQTHGSDDRFNVLRAVKFNLPDPVTPTGSQPVVTSDVIAIPPKVIQPITVAEEFAEANMSKATISAGLNTFARFPDPKKGEYVVRVGQTLSLVWNTTNLSNVNIVFYKDTTRLLVTNKTTRDGQNKYSLFIDNSFFSPEFLPCKIRIEMKENPDIFNDSPTFKVLRQQG
jgi:hypothetical protein